MLQFHEEEIPGVLGKVYYLTRDGEFVCTMDKDAYEALKAVFETLK